MTRRMRKLLGLAIALLVIGGGAGAAQAEEHAVCPICERASSNTAGYGTHAVNTLGRGAANTLLGWTEIIRQPTQTAKEGGNVLVGIGRGVGQGVKRTLSGVGEVLTFWTPKMNDNYVTFAKDCPICMGKAKKQ